MVDTDVGSIPDVSGKESDGSCDGTENFVERAPDPPADCNYPLLGNSFTPKSILESKNNFGSPPNKNLDLHCPKSIKQFQGLAKSYRFLKILFDCIKL